MLYEFSFSNFQSFLEETHIDFRVSQKTRKSDWIAERKNGSRLLKVMSILGANGAGKTALLKPLAFLGWFISSSFQNPQGSEIPIAAHFSAAPDLPTTFSCTVEIDNMLWRYELSCNRERVLHEALYNRPERHFRYLFIREWDPDKNGYQVRRKENDFHLPEEAIKNLRPDVSLISWAAQYGVPLATRFANWPVVFTNVSHIGRIPSGDEQIFAAARHFQEHSAQRERMVQLLSSWDLGLENLVIRDQSFLDRNNPENTVMVPTPYGQHHTQSGMKELFFPLESSGTKGAFIHLMRLLSALENGGIAVIDELEGDLHPKMLEPMLGLFADPDINPHNAQLLFTCHSPEVLNILDKSQIVLVEKNEYCESSAILMDDIEGIRADENYYAKYMAGAYGATPQI